LVRRRLIAWLPVLVLAACQPTTTPTPAPMQASTSSVPAESSSGATPFQWPGEHEENSPLLSFPSATDAIAFLGEHMDGDIALPTWVPSNVRLDVGTSVSVYTDDGVRGAQVKLTTEQGDVWGIMYGRSGLDGCDGARHARSVTVSGQPGLLSVATDPEGSSRKWVQLIWPATLKHSDGVFGLFGWLSPRAVLAMAESMPVVGAPPVADAGC
jgi:hypothetical protein